MIKKHVSLIALCAPLIMTSVSVASDSSQRTYELWEPAPAPNRGHSFSKKEAGGHFFIGSGYPADPDWELWSYPIGNGYMGATLFGRTDVERIQVTEKTLYNYGPYGGGGLTSFMELYIEIGHNKGVSDYKRSLSLNDAIHRTEYTHDGVCYSQESFASYPDNVLVVHTRSSKPGAVSFTLRPEIPYLQSQKAKNKRTGTVKVEGNRILVSGTQAPFSLNYGADIQVVTEGGKLTPGSNTITVEGADRVTIIAAFGTNYELSERTFKTRDFSKKCDPGKTPADALRKRVSAAVRLGVRQLQRRHIEDYQNLFGRVHIDLGQPAVDSAATPTSQLTKDSSTYIEELMFQYGRYLLIASSRENSLPAGLQGVWTQSEVTPWSGAYWHNINVQMNYWGAMTANLAETFESYIEYFKVYEPAARKEAEAYIKKVYAHKTFAPSDTFGWTIGTSGNPFTLSKPGLHSGPGTGGLTSKLLVEYYDFTQDEKYLREVAYPAVMGMSKFLSHTLQQQSDGTLLVYPSYSPEIIHKGELPEYAKGKLNNHGCYETTGATFDQGFVWENYHDTLRFAELLGIQTPFLNQISDEIEKLDPILIGESGQLKEFRDEKYYGDIGEAHHRHLSHLCTLYPGTLVNDNTPEWLEAAKVALDKRGPGSTGWSIVHRMALWARVKDGEKALSMYRRLIEDKTLPNLWTTHPPFQIDASLGIVACVPEMLLQSHSGFIEVLPALPEKWASGSFEGLVARGNFVVDASWKQKSLTELTVTSRAGVHCKIRIPENRKNPTVTTLDTGEKVPITVNESILSFPTTKGRAYTVCFESDAKKRK